MKKYYNLTAVVLFVLMLRGCFPFSIGTPPARVPMRDLLVDISTYPPGWVQTSISKNGFNIGNDIENAKASFRYISEIDNVSSHFVWRFSSTRDAENGYNLLLKQDLSNSPGLSESKEIEFTSSIAQQMSVRCEQPASNRLLCSILARYGVYVSEFTAYIDNNSMNRTDFIRILNEIERKMVLSVQNS